MHTAHTPAIQRYCYSNLLDFNLSNCELLQLFELTIYISSHLLALVVVADVDNEYGMKCRSRRTARGEQGHQPVRILHRPSRTETGKNVKTHNL